MISQFFFFFSLRACVLIITHIDIFSIRINLYICYYFSVAIDRGPDCGVNSDFGVRQTCVIARRQKTTHLHNTTTHTERNIAPKQKRRAQ